MTQTSLKHVAVTQKQFDKTWNDLPAEYRFWPESEQRYKTGICCVIVGNLLIWVDYLMPETQWSEEVQSAVETIRRESPSKES